MAQYATDFQRTHLRQGETWGSRYRLTAAHLAPRGTAGARLGKGIGNSLEFMDHRQYQPGDDLRRIDWAALARTDQWIIKLYREEVAAHLDLLLDCSQSIDLTGTPKAAAALSLAALIATAADNAAFTRNVWAVGDDCRDIEGGRLRPEAWHLPSLKPTVRTAEALGQGGRWRRRGLRVLVSDLLWPADPQRVMARLADNAAAVVVVQVAARADLHGPERGNLRLIDSETGEARDVFVDAAVQERYRQRVARHQEQWHRACRGCGAAMATVVAEEFLNDGNVDELLRREILAPAS
jgi:uncharacterized protein (DUF58 family)